ncbi:hypothetical protein E2C01_006801 [Portunus trituberculatus]|uniref:Uncharacterized protein n=1 Tax=Portunus trituberculatus TaxID=210409 RepID=A0A5B7CXA1_PORTR|nr:hypothetical protein [Portunus trituberculatus]
MRCIGWPDIYLSTNTITPQLKGKINVRHLNPHCSSKITVADGKPDTVHDISHSVMHRTKLDDNTMHNILTHPPQEHSWESQGHHHNQPQENSKNTTNHTQPSDTLHPGSSHCVLPNSPRLTLPPSMTFGGRRRVNIL